MCNKKGFMHTRIILHTLVLWEGNASFTNRRICIFSHNMYDCSRAYTVNWCTIINAIVDDVLESGTVLLTQSWLTCVRTKTKADLFLGMLEKERWKTPLCKKYWHWPWDWGFSYKGYQGSEGPRRLSPL